MQIAHPGIGTAQIAQDFKSAISGIIVNEDHFPGVASQDLIEARYNLTHIVALIEGRNDNGHQRRAETAADGGLAFFANEPIPFR